MYGIKRFLFSFIFFYVHSLFGLELNIEEFSFLHNPSFYEIEAENGKIFAAGEDGISVFEDKGSKIPSKISSVKLEDKINVILSKNPYLFIGTDKGFYIYDLSNINNPIKLSFISFSKGVESMDKEGDYIYVADKEGISVIDIYDKTSPKIVTSYETKGDSKDIKVRNGYIYVADGEAGMEVLFIEHSGTISKVGSYESNGTADKIAVVNNEAYVSYGKAGFRVIDISDPENPSLLFDCDGPSHNCYATDIAVKEDGKFCYILDKFSGIKVANTQNPEDIHLASEYRQLGESSSMAVDGDKIYIANKDTGIQIIDVSDGFHAKRVGYYESLKSPIKVAAKDDYLYVADYLGGFNIVDFSDPSSLKVLSNIEIGCMAESIDIDKKRDLAYVTDFCKGLYVIDISDKENPKILSSLVTPGRAYDVKSDGEYLYIADRAYGLEIIDVKDSSKPFIASNVESTSFSIGVDVSGNYAYIAEYNDTLSVVDIFDPLNPQKVGVYDTELGFAIDVKGWRDFVYVANDGLGIQVIDVSDKNSPSLLSVFGLGGSTTLYHAVGIDVKGDYIYGVYKDSGFAVIDASDKKEMKLIKSFDANGSMEDVLVYKNYAIVSDKGYGIRIYKTNGDEIVKEFIKRVYTKLLKRDADEEGLNYYLNRLLKGDSAAEVEEIFFHSEELGNLNLTAKEFVKRTYETLLGREPDQEGSLYWESMIEDKHIPKEIIFYKFIMSKEFGKLCDHYGIVNYFKDDALKAFLQRMYLLVLDRTADGAGMEFWFEALKDKTKSAQDIAADFFDSKEFKERNLSDEDFVDIAYRALMDREAEEEGKSFWLGFLHNHSRLDLVREFINSEEFANISRQYGILGK